MSVISFTPTPTGEAMIKDRSKFKYAAGPIGSGKTTACLFDLFQTAMDQEPLDGLRRTRMGLLRNTLEQLKTTTLKTALEWFPDGEVCNWSPSNKTMTFDFQHPSGDGTRVQSEWYLISLDEEKDIRRLLSFEFTALFFNELREFREDLIVNAMSRVGRYPKRVNARGFPGPTYPHGVADSNPPVEGSWLHTNTLRPPPHWKVFLYPPGVLRDNSTALGWRVNPDAENLENLHESYYQDNLEANFRNPDWVSVYLGNEFAKRMDGSPVFGKLFSFDFHVSKQPLRFDPKWPVMISLDPGLFPGALFAQLTDRGQLRVLAEAYGNDVAFQAFVENDVIPILSRQFQGGRFSVVIDPSALMRSSLSKTRDNAIDILKRLNIQAFPAPTNAIEPRIEAVEKFLMSNVGGQAKFVVDASCEVLIDALARSYRYRKKKDGQLEEKPEKVHPVCEAADCAQYLCLAASSPKLLRSLNQAFMPRRQAKPARLDLAGWV